MCGVRAVEACGGGVWWRHVVEGCGGGVRLAYSAGSRWVGRRVDDGYDEDNRRENVG